MPLVATARPLLLRGVAALSLALLASGCGPKQGPKAAAEQVAPTAKLVYAYGEMPYEDALELFVGTWRGTVSTVVYNVWREGESLRVEAWDSADWEWMVIQEVSWDGRFLSFKSTMPSTDWGLDNRLEMVSRNRLQQLISGSAEAQLVLYRVDGLTGPDRPEQNATAPTP